MPLYRHQIDAAAEALRRVLAFERPADAVLHAFFRSQPALGAGDRAFVAETVYGVLRHSRHIEALLTEVSPRRMVLAYLARIAGISAREIGPAVNHDETVWIGRIKSLALDALPLAAKAELPDWLVARLKTHMREDEILTLGRALQQPAPLDLRINSLSAVRDDVLQELADGGIEAAAAPYSPVGVRVTGRPAINRHPLFERGAVEVQDEGSQLLSYLVAPRRRELVVDFCAGAGGKALMLGAMMQSHGRVYAFDVSARRLAALRPRLKRSGLSNLHPQLIRNENDAKVKRLAGKIDRVLVDAPCSGLGTLRRNPDLKWRQSPATIEDLRRKQAAILTAAASLVKPGGRLVYATCSMLPEENQDIVAAFLAEQKAFALLHCGEVLHEQRIGLDTGEYLRLWPHLHGTDGFFAAAMERSTGNSNRPERP